jgi:hypothetical protein
MREVCKAKLPTNFDQSSTWTTQTALRDQYRAQLPPSKTPPPLHNQNKTINDDQESIWTTQTHLRDKYHAQLPTQNVKELKHNGDDDQESIWTTQTHLRDKYHAQLPTGKTPQNINTTKELRHNGGEDQESIWTTRTELKENEMYRPKMPHVSGVVTGVVVKNDCGVSCGIVLESVGDLTCAMEVNNQVAAFKTSPLAKKQSDESSIDDEYKNHTQLVVNKKLEDDLTLDDNIIESIKTNSKSSMQSV